MKAGYSEATCVTWEFISCYSVSAVVTVNG